MSILRCQKLQNVHGCTHGNRHKQRAHLSSILMRFLSDIEWRRWRLWTWGWPRTSSSSLLGELALSSSMLCLQVLLMQRRPALRDPRYFPAHISVSGLLLLTAPDLASCRNPPKLPLLSPRSASSFYQIRITKSMFYFSAECSCVTTNYTSMVQF